VSSQPQAQTAAEDAVRAGIDALRRGDGTGAKAALERGMALGFRPEPWFPIAQACRLMGDGPGEAAALDRFLAAEPRHLAALIMRGDLSARVNDPKGATAYYQQAMRVAASGGPIPPQLQPELARIQHSLDNAARQYRAHLEESLAKAGFGRLPPRMREAIAILSGEAEVHLQQPTSFFYPGLPHIAFYDRTDFGWAGEMEAATDAIRGELEVFLAEGAPGFRPYVEAVPGRPNKAHSLLDNPDWSALHLLREGRPTEHAARFPATMKALEAAPIPVIDGRSPMALFSLLKPGTHILPHNGMINTRLICHLPLIVPPDCALRVGNETHAWEPGRLTIFDDSILHEAWNRSDAIRVILLFEIWRPEISLEERAALTAMYESIGLYTTE
jgi:hypothetical protein